VCVCVCLFVCVCVYVYVCVCTWVSGTIFWITSLLTSSLACIELNLHFLESLQKAFREITGEQQCGPHQMGSDPIDRLFAGTEVIVSRQQSDAHSHTPTHSLSPTHTDAYSETGDGESAHHLSADQLPPTKSEKFFQISVDVKVGLPQRASAQ
jgi:hypothetical protein